MYVIHPASCKGYIPEDLSPNHIIGELKIDGARNVLYLGCDPYGTHDNGLYSKRESVVSGKMVDNTATARHITGLTYKGLKNTVLDVEAFSVDLGTTTAILNSSFRKAKAKQEEVGFLTLNVIDIVYYKGKDVRSWPLWRRKELQEEVIKKMNNTNVVAIPYWSRSLVKRFQSIAADGGEGLVIKNLNSAYGMDWAKMKKSYDISVIISGYREGKNSNYGTVGALEVSVWYKDQLVPIGHVNAGTQRQRNDFNKNRKWYIGKALDVWTHEVTEPSDGFPLGKLRKPSFFRLRDDLGKKECSYKRLQYALKQAKYIRDEY